MQLAEPCYDIRITGSGTAPHNWSKYSYMTFESEASISWPSPDALFNRVTFDLYEPADGSGFWGGTRVRLQLSHGISAEETIRTVLMESKSKQFRADDHSIGRTSTAFFYFDRRADAERLRDLLSQAQEACRALMPR